MEKQRSEVQKRVLCERFLTGNIVSKMSVLYRALGLNTDKYSDKQQFCLLTVSQMKVLWRVFAGCFSILNPFRNSLIRVPVCVHSWRCSVRWWPCSRLDMSCLWITCRITTESSRSNSWDKSSHPTLASRRSTLLVRTSQTRIHGVNKLG